jgi:signal transduction histidine kinase
LECEYRIRGKGGDFRWVRDHGIGVHGDDGRVKRLVGAVRDITDIREAEAELGRAETRLLDSLESLSDGFLLVDAENRVQLWNSRYLEIFGNAAGAGISDMVTKGRPFFDMIREGYERGMFPSYAGGVEEWIARRREAWKDPAAELEVQLSDGCWILINEHRTSDGGRVAIYTDITELKRRQEESDAARARFEEAIEAVSSGFVLFDSDDRIVVCNSKYREYFPDLVDMVTPGTPFRDLIEAAVERGLLPLAGDDPEGFLAGILEQRVGDGRFREQHMRDGLWLQISDHATKDGGIVSIYTDVTDLKTREQELRTQSAILEATLENMEQGISMVDSDLRVVMFNQKFLDYMQFPGAEFQRGFPIEKAFRFNAERGEYGDGEVNQQVQERMDLARKCLPHRFERTRQDGVVLEIVGNPADGGGFVTTYTDITERKKAEQVLRESEAQLSAALQEFNAILDTIEYGVIFMGPDLRARITNRAFGKIWGIPQEFIDGSPTMQELIEYNRDTGIYDVTPENWDQWIEGRVEAVREGDVAPMELHRADGMVLQYQGISLPDGGRMLTYFDITELKKREVDHITAKHAAEQALLDLQQAQDRLVQAEKMASLGQLTAGIAHEIKNPLNFINNFAKLSVELLDELNDILEDPIATLPKDDRDDAEDLTDTVKQNLDKISEHGKRADSIVKNMLLHSREGPSERQRVDLNALAEEALNLAYHGARAENPNFNIAMTKMFSPEVSEVECYPQDLMRVFLNLISNGMYAANEREASAGQKAVRIEPAITVMTRDLGDKVAIEIRDNGAGIPADIQEKIFTPFFTTKPAGEGTGLGLSLSYDIVVKQHGGTMSVESEPDEFTVFVVTVPRVLPDTKTDGASKA